MMRAGRAENMFMHSSSRLHSNHVHVNILFSFLLLLQPFTAQPWVASCLHCLEGLCPSRGNVGKTSHAAGQGERRDLCHWAGWPTARPRAGWPTACPRAGRSTACPRAGGRRLAARLSEPSLRLALCLHGHRATQHTNRAAQGVAIEPSARSGPLCMEFASAARMLHGLSGSRGCPSAHAGQGRLGALGALCVQSFLGGGLSRQQLGTGRSSGASGKRAHIGPGLKWTGSVVCSHVQFCSIPRQTCTSWLSMYIFSKTCHSGKC